MKWLIKREMSRRLNLPKKQAIETIDEYTAFLRFEERKKYLINEFARGDINLEQRGKDVDTKTIDVFADDVLITPENIGELFPIEKYKVVTAEDRKDAFETIEDLEKLSLLPNETRQKFLEELRNMRESIKAMIQQPEKPIEFSEKETQGVALVKRGNNKCKN
jgi:SepF-like predicted cell division protein (DUF552 family)